MSPRMGSSQDDERFDDPAHDEIRALLDDARVTEPMPAEVVARLDDVLAGLRPEQVAQEPVEEQPSNVVPLRRRWAPRLLTAAAVVVVAGGAAVGVGQVVQQDGGADSVTALEDSDGTTTQDREQSAPESADAPEPGTASLDGFKATKSLPSLTAADFDDTALVLARQFRMLGGLVSDLQNGQPYSDAPPTTLAPLDGDDLSASPTPQRLALNNLLGIEDLRGRTARDLAELCAGPVGNEARKVRIRFEGELAVLLFGTETDGQQPVSAWTCDGSRLLARTTLPVP